MPEDSKSCNFVKKGHLKVIIHNNRVLEKWEQERLRRMEDQKKRKTKRLENIEVFQKVLKIHKKLTVLSLLKKI